RWHGGEDGKTIPRWRGFDVAFGTIAKWSTSALVVVIDPIRTFGATVAQGQRLANAQRARFKNSRPAS
ncbi:MAG: hypothetical protein WAM74_19410, partial [Xanthobacteraceae bacterium]